MPSLIPKTYKKAVKAVIQDWRLGALHFLFKLSIFIYALIHLVYFKGWSKRVIISGFGKGRFITPPLHDNCSVGENTLAEDSCPPYLQPGLLPPYRGNSISHVNQALPQCMTSKDIYNYTEYEYRESVDGTEITEHADTYVYASAPFGIGRRMCMPQLDAIDNTQHPGDGTLFLTTRWNSWKEATPNGYWEYTGSRSGLYSDYLTYNPENYSMAFDHSYVGINTPRNKISANMVGFVAVSNEKLCNRLEDANKYMDPYEPNKKYIGDPSDVWGTWNKLMDIQDTMCLLNLNRTYQCENKRQLALELDDVVLDVDWMIATKECHDARYLVSTLLLASYNKKDSRTTPLLDSPNFEHETTCFADGIQSTGKAYGNCGADEEVVPSSSPTLSDTQTEIHLSSTGKLVPQPYRMTGMDVNFIVTITNEGHVAMSHVEKYTIKPNQMQGSAAILTSPGRFQPPSGPGGFTRTMTKLAGIRFRFIFLADRVLIFSWSSLMTVAISGFLLLSLSNTIVDFVMRSPLCSKEFREEYTKITRIKSNLMVKKKYKKRRDSDFLPNPLEEEKKKGNELLTEKTIEMNHETC